PTPPVALLRGCWQGEGKERAAGRDVPSVLAQPVRGNHRRITTRTWAPGGRPPHGGNSYRRRLQRGRGPVATAGLTYSALRCRVAEVARLPSVARSEVWRLPLPPAKMRSSPHRRHHRRGRLASLDWPRG